MRSLCSLDAVFWEPISEHDILAGLPLAIYKRLLSYLFEVEVAPQLVDHLCVVTAPCAVLRRAMRVCAPHLFVCKTWKKLASAILSQHQFAIFEAPSVPGYYNGISYKVALKYTVAGRYRALHAIEWEDSQ
jgi:hypothetical protein